MATFSAQVDEYVTKYKERLEAVVKQSAQEVIEEAQRPEDEGGNLPVDTGFLRNSLVSGLNGSTSFTGANSYALAIAGANLGDTIQAGWTANYARHQEYGSNGRQGRFFMRSAAQNWQAIVARNAEKLRNS